MADQIKDARPKAEAPVTPVESVTEETPAKADETSGPNATDAKANQPPVRTNRPDVPIAQTLVAGAGEHHGRELDHLVGEVEVDAEGFDRDGRYLGEPVARSDK